MGLLFFGFATNGYRSNEPFESIAEQHVRICAEGKIIAFANICWGFATNGFNATALFEAVAEQHERIARDGR